MTDAAREKWREVRAMDVPGSLRLGPNSFDRYINDPKRLGFFLARYAAAAKFLRRCSAIIDIGSGDSLGAVTFLTDTIASAITCLDFDESLYRYSVTELSDALATARPSDVSRIKFLCTDFMDTRFDPGSFDGACSLDVVEHIDPTRSTEFIRAISALLSDDGVAVVGTPNALAAQYASTHSAIGHINLLTPDALRDQMEQYFRHVFVLSMNDSVVHLGFDKMANYLLAVGCK